METQKSLNGSTAWRFTEPDAPGLFALVYNAGSMKIAESPDTDLLTFEIYEDHVDDIVGAIEIGGRAGLNLCYLTHIGHAPDKEPDGPLPIGQLIENVAAHLLLRRFEERLSPTQE